MEKYLYFDAGTVSPTLFPASALTGIHPTATNRLALYFRFNRAFPQGRDNSMYELTIDAGTAFPVISAIYEAIATSESPTIVIADDSQTEYISPHVTACAALETNNSDYNWNPGYNGYHTRIDILPRDFINDEDEAQRALVVEEDTSGKLGVRKGSGTGDMYATVQVPAGFMATHVRIYASATINVAVFTGNLSTGAVVALETGDTSAAIDITDTDSADNRFLWIKVTTTGATDLVWGGTVTIAAQ